MNDQKFFYAILTIQMMFQEFSRHEGFGMYGTIGALKVPSKNFFFQCLWGAIADNMSDFTDNLHQWNPAVTAQNLQPYLQDNHLPNVVSFIHLISQSICLQHVWSLLSMLIVQTGINFEMIEQVMRLPKGFICVYKASDNAVGSFLERATSPLKDKLPK